MTDKQIKHLEFLQNAITRTNSNSFQMKGIAITIVSAMLAIYASNSKPLVFLMAVPSTIIFWCIDSYYLQVERKLRAIYDDVIGIKSHVAVGLFEFPLKKYKGKDSRFNYLNCMFSSTIWTLYLPISFGLVLLYFYFTCNLI